MRLLPIIIALVLSGCMMAKDAAVGAPYDEGDWGMGAGGDAGMAAGDPGQGDEVPGGDSDGCLAEGEDYEALDTTVRCCWGTTPIPVEAPEGGYCVSPSTSRLVCTLCGDDSCGAGETICNCPQDCVGATGCSAGACAMLDGDYTASGNCVGLPAPATTLQLVQDGCSLGLPVESAAVLGATACVDDMVIYTAAGCQGLVSGSSLYFTCPVDGSSDATCITMLQP